jgi:serine/threonine protein phosphatase 1
VAGTRRPVGQTLIVGDIHGCFAELQALLDKAGVATDAEIIALGDLVDRGPEPAQVLAFFDGQPRHRSILGNHERKHIRSFRGEIPAALSQRLTRQRLGEAAYPAAVAFMQRLPLYLELPGFLLTHGFWEPGVPLAEQRENILVGTLGGERYLHARYGEPWYAHYDGPSRLIVGHHDYLRDGRPLVYQDRVIGLDTGCVYGGALTGLVLPEERFVSVPSRENHWQRAREQHDRDFRNADRNE